MAEESAISWTDSTFNPWIGCTRVGPGCDHCYAARDNTRRKWVPSWGEKGSTGSPRRRTKTWGQPIKWQREAAEFLRLHGHPRRVFCASLADVFDNEAPDEWRTDLWALLRATPDLRWMLLTKRIGNARKMLPPDWVGEWQSLPDGGGDYRRINYPHVGIMATMVNQEEWARDIRKLRDTPAAWHGVSVEPMLGPIEVFASHALLGWSPDWIITGGESGPGFRDTQIGWVKSARDQCEMLGIAFHHKQWGGTRPKENGCLIDGEEHKAFPPALAA